MDPVVKVAAEMGPEWLYVVASILVVVVGVLGVVTWWLIKKKTGKTEKEIEGLQAEHRLFMEKLGIIAERLEARNRADDVLEKRLASGAESFKNNQDEHQRIMSTMGDRFEIIGSQMKSVSDTITKVQGFFVDFASEYVKTEQFNRHCDDDKESRRDLKKDMDGLNDRWDEYNRETIGLLKKMEGRLDAMSEILTRREPPVGRGD